MKKLITVLICLQFIIFPVNNVARAEEAPTENATYDANSQHQGGYDFYMKQILSLGTSVLGAAIINQCYKAILIPSIATFMAGAVINIGVELLGGNELK